MQWYKSGKAICRAHEVEMKVGSKNAYLDEMLMEMGKRPAKSTIIDILTLLP